MTISDDDRKAFARATSGVRPLKPRNMAEVELPRPKPRALQSRAARREVLEASLSGEFTSDAIEETAFRRDSVTLRTFSRLRRGEYALEAEIDLHGMRLNEARAALLEFIGECAGLGLGCIRVIHGKGSRSGPEGPVLKPSVHHWLSQWNQVQAFVTAQPRHGGSGAVYVLLGKK